jgi:hypothetical protein
MGWLVTIFAASPRDQLEHRLKKNTLPPALQPP